MAKMLSGENVAPLDWTEGFRTGASGGMTCDLCRCVVRQTPGDAQAHRMWHLSLGTAHQ